MEEGSGSHSGSKRMGDSSKQQTTNCNLKSANETFAILHNAIEYHKKELSIAQGVENRYEEGQAYSNLTLAYYSLRNFKKAIEYYEKHL